MNNKFGSKDKAAAGGPGKIETGSSSRPSTKGHTVSIHDLLPVGKKNRITLAELVDRTGVKDPRELRKVIHKERAAGKLIASTSDKGGGYYIPDGIEELREFVQYIERCGRSLFFVLKTARAKLKELEANGE